MGIGIVTGASRGFGRALASSLVAQGWLVVVDARDAERLRAASDEMNGPGRVVSVAGDVTSDEHRRALVDAAEVLGGLDLLVHNAGALGPSPLPPIASLDPEALRDLLDANLVAPLALTQLALPALRRSDAPTVVALSSDAAVEAYPGWGGYGASKAALDHLMAVFGVEEPDLRVYAVDPGDLRTDMHQAAFPGEDISDRPLPEAVVPDLLALLAQRPPSGRYRCADVRTPLPA